jgi:hypothetical protein
MEKLFKGHKLCFLAALKMSIKKKKIKNSAIKVCS